ncbi:UV-B-induced protein At3g17800, chloroplastic [Phalaenopsis equestris]|uniref:UV-B-induced protein At3g17800, chloroplastic n=1 Tax=Phalaenopsis equestris TaxID=78828 RepID=UPI0009E36680|nr:UV-B-induced protein At3g17800, chloroplastic [Phalaenopsis equestris]
MPICAAGADGLLVVPRSHFVASGFRSPSPDIKFLPFIPIDSRTSFFNKCCHFGWPKIGTCSESRQFHSLKVRASDNSGQSQMPIAPLQLQSPTGQLLSQIMRTHPHLLPAAIDQQLDQLQSDRDAQKWESPPPSQDFLLYRRIAEVREKDRQKSLEEIIYCFIVQKFLEKNILMIPKISPTTHPTRQVDFWPNQEQKLEAIHSPDAMEMIQGHLTLILGERLIGPPNTIVRISKLKLGKLYAASIMYGYFLKRVDERYQLERTMNTLPKRIPDQRILDGLKPNPLWDMDSLVLLSPDEDIDGEPDEKSYKLRSYVMCLDADTLQRYATIRSNEAVSLIEKQTQSLFGRPDIKIAEDGTLDTSNDELVGMSFSGLTMLVLEAVAFGSFLWQAENYVESKYHFVIN